MTYMVDVRADRMGFKSDIEQFCHIHRVCDIIDSGYDVINIVDAMTYKQWYDVIKRGCDVINSTYGVLHAVCVITYILSLWYPQSSGCDYTDTLSVMSDTVGVLSFIHQMRCHIYCVWCNKPEMSCQRYSGCDVTSVEYVMSYRVGVLSWIESMWCHEYNIVTS